MLQKAFAFAAACSLLATLAVGPVGAQGSSQTLSTSICGSGDLANVVAIYDFDSPTYRGASESVPPGVKSYLAQQLTGRLQACAQHAGPAAASACSPAPRESDPHAL